jgi:cysteinyl-tRNA synthetase
MAEAHLGETIDIHAGGNDLMFPHHENEIAQSTCAHGGRMFARYWLHNGMLTFNGRKMSKSLGNVMLLHELLQKHPPEVLRYLLMKAHYRQPLDWSDSALAQARSTLDSWYGALRDLADVEVAATEARTPDEIESALLDDLNTPQALAAIAQLASAARRPVGPEQRKAAKTALLAGGAILGLLQMDPEVWFKQGAGIATGDSASTSDADAAPNPEEIDGLLAQRDAARKARNFAEADRIRDALAAKGIAIEDGAQGTRWKVVNPNECTT